MTKCMVGHCRRLKQKFSEFKEITTIFYDGVVGSVVKWDYCDSFPHARVEMIPLKSMKKPSLSQ